MILLDTNALIDLPTAHLEQEWVSSVLCLGELRFGVEVARGDVRQARLRRVNALLRLGMTWLEFDERDAESYGILAAQTHRRAPGKARSKDMLIAAQAHSRGIALMTRNAQDFAAVAHLVEIMSPDDSEN